MKQHQQLRVLEEEYSICKKKLSEYTSLHKAMGNLPIRNLNASLTDTEYQITIYYMHLCKLKDELIKLYWKARFQ